MKKLPVMAVSSSLRLRKRRINPHHPVDAAKTILVVVFVVAEEEVKEEEEEEEEEVWG
jgi:hypothetical protein